MLVPAPRKKIHILTMASVSAGFFLPLHWAAAADLLPRSLAVGQALFHASGPLHLLFIPSAEQVVYSCCLYPAHFLSCKWQLPGHSPENFLVDLFSQGYNNMMSQPGLGLFSSILHS